MFWTTADRSDTLELVEVATGRTRWRTTLGKPVAGVAVAPGGRWLAVTEAEGDRLRRIERLIAGLDSPAFADRERAARELGELGVAARRFVAKALRPGVSLEARTRLEKLLAAPPDPFATPAGLRQLRAVEALERIGSADARRVLERLADGSPGDDPLGREARLAVGRMRR